MPFVKATIDIKPASIGTGLKVSLKKHKNTMAPASMTLSISGAAAAKLGWRGGDKIEVLIGEAEHHGLMRLRKNNSAGDAVVDERADNLSAKGKGKRASYQIIRLGHQPAFIDRSEAARWCQWEILDDGWTEITLPLWADETAPRKPIVAPPAAKPPAPVVNGAVKKRDVAPELMGDPPPGRREMLERMGKMKP